MDCTKTLRLRIKDKHARVLSAMAREVNQVWNFCNETSHRAIRERRQWLSGYDLQRLTNGFSKCDGVQIGSPTVQQVCEDYAKARKQFKRAKLRGVESFGMICSASELGLAESSDGILPLPADAPLGEDFRAWLALDDHCIEVDLTPDRGDCLGLAGLARELKLGRGRG